MCSCLARLADIHPTVASEDRLTKRFFVEADRSQRNPTPAGGMAAEMPDTGDRAVRALLDPGLEHHPHERVVLIFDSSRLAEDFDPSITRSGHIDRHGNSAVADWVFASHAGFTR